jgi:quaternary ammonium compound-resistance protein SugE
MVWPIAMKKAEGFTKLWPSVATFSALITSFGLMTLATRTLPIGTSYAIWTGMGAAGTAIYGMMVLGEPREAARIVCLFLIVTGTVGLKLFSKAG